MLNRNLYVGHVRVLIKLRLNVTVNSFKRKVLFFLGGAAVQCEVFTLIRQVKAHGGCRQRQAHARNVCRNGNEICIRLLIFASTALSSADWDTVYLLSSPGDGTLDEGTDDVSTCSDEK